MPQIVCEGPLAVAAVEGSVRGSATLNNVIGKWGDEMSFGLLVRPQRVDRVQGGSAGDEGREDTDKDGSSGRQQMWR